MSRLGNKRNSCDHRKNARHGARVCDLLLPGNPCSQIATRESKDDSIQRAPKSKTHTRFLLGINAGNLEKKYGRSPKHEVAEKNSENAFHGLLPISDTVQLLDSSFRLAHRLLLCQGFCPLECLLQVAAYVVFAQAIKKTGLLHRKQRLFMNAGKKEMCFLLG